MDGAAPNQVAGAGGLHGRPGARLGVVDEPELLAGLGDLHHVHEAGGVGRVRTHLAVHLHVPLHQDGRHLPTRQRIPAQTVRVSRLLQQSTGLDAAHSPRGGPDEPVHGVGDALETVAQQNGERQALPLLVWAGRRLGGLRACKTGSAIGAQRRAAERYVGSGSARKCPQACRASNGWAH